MKKILRALFLLASGFLFLIPAFSSVGGCGSGVNAPPASIPAPVSSLITVSPPNQDGIVLVSGAPGAVLPNASVIAANLTQGGFVQRLEELFLRSAHAQVQAAVTADDQGAFDLELEASEGDEIGIRQIVDSEPSDVTIVNVP
ncbi:MAG TPA: hypothetical protein VFX30_00315 [bacterium]|nr:hypothetical protein [bacterium]